MPANMNILSDLGTLCCAVLLVACGKPAEPAQKRDLATKTVRVVRAELRPMARTIAVTGTLAAREQSTLSAKVAGRIQNLSVDVGSVVRQGDLLAQVEPRDSELAVQQAGAALAQARTALGLPLEGDDDRIELAQISAVKLAKAVLAEASKNRDRVHNLSQSGIASQAELDTVEATHNVALARYDVALEEARSRAALLGQRRAEYEIARKQLADASIRAPFDGAIQSRTASVGEYVTPGTPIAALVKTDPLRLRLQVPERESSLVRTGQVVHLFVEGDTNDYQGCLARLSPALDERNRLLLVEADIPAQGSLRPGLYARANIVIQEREGALAVPTNALVTFAGIEKVVTVQQGKALEKVVSTGRRQAEWVEVLSGLGVDEEVVLRPVGLRTGQAVSVTKATEQEKAERMSAVDQAHNPVAN
jgi:RND family efflux transporter MFP subunit